MVSQINEQQPAMIPLAVNPAGQAGGDAGLGGAQRAAIMGAIGRQGAALKRRLWDVSSVGKGKGCSFLKKEPKNVYS